MAGPRVAAALEFLSVRPLGEVAVPVPGAADAQDLSELLQRVDPSQDDAAEDGDNDNEAASAEPPEGAAADTGEHHEEDDEAGETEAMAAHGETERSPRLMTPPKRYPMADDLWGESQLELQNHSQADADRDVTPTEPTEPFSNRAVAGPTDELNQLLNRRWTSWGTFCPASLKEEGKVVEGQKQFAVEFAGKIFLLADEEKSGKFLRDPKKYVDTPPSLPSGTCVYLFGPSYAGASKQARLLSRTYGLIPVDVGKELAEGHRRVEEEKQRLLEEEQRRKAEILEQERLQKLRQREAEERKLMRLEDDPDRLALAFPEAADEAPEALCIADGATEARIATGPPGRDQLSRSTGSLVASSSAGADSSSLAASDLGTARSPADALPSAEGDVSKEDKFMTSEEEEKLLKEGHALGRQDRLCAVLVHLSNS